MSEYTSTGERIIARQGTCLLISEPVECPEVAIPALKSTPVHTETSWSASTSYYEGGYVEVAK